MVDVGNVPLVLWEQGDCWSVQLSLLSGSKVIWKHVPFSGNLKDLGRQVGYLQCYIALFSCTWTGNQCGAALACYMQYEQITGLDDVAGFKFNFCVFWKRRKRLFGLSIIKKNLYFPSQAGKYYSVNHQILGWIPSEPSGWMDVAKPN